MFYDIVTSINLFIFSKDFKIFFVHLIIVLFPKIEHTYIVYLFTTCDLAGSLLHTFIYIASFRIIYILLIAYNILLYEKIYNNIIYKYLIVDIESI